MEGKKFGELARLSSCTTEEYSRAVFQWDGWREKEKERDRGGSSQVTLIDGKGKRSKITEIPDPKGRRGIIYCKEEKGVQERGDKEQRGEPTRKILGIRCDLLTFKMFQKDMHLSGRLGQIRNCIRWALKKKGRGGG